MNLDEFYDSRQISAKKRIKAEKNIVLIIGDDKEDVSWFFEQTGLDEYEVPVTLALIVVSQSLSLYVNFALGLIIKIEADSFLLLFITLSS